ncbi:MAG: hypothetical protein BGO96_08045 [Micrococcales bacterium 73-15]|uniref:SseB family protein n=1 Tax=Salana multivorans TaxID=120377 RepID=UPI000964FA03|nr:SseB family protein [Salana multivorans]OJX95584.1 MAG: hypothetical protein BGO96_08045 [Micrococcales bacterium 73-15]
MPLADFLPRTGQERGKELPPVSPFAGDDGSCPAELAAALALTGAERLRAVVAALASARVLVPVVAHEESDHDADVRERLTGHRERRRSAGLVVLDDTGGSADGDATVPEAAAPGAQEEAASCHDGERRASASMVTVRTPDGREALPVFSSVAALGRWRRDARPTPHTAVRAAMAAVDEAGGVLVIDAGSPSPVLVPRPAVWALARGEEWVPAVEDAGVVEAVRSTVLAVPGVRHAAVEPGARAEVKVVLGVVPGLTREQVQHVAGAVASALGESVVVAERVDSLELALTTA